MIDLAAGLTEIADLEREGRANEAGAFRLLLSMLPVEKDVDVNDLDALLGPMTADHQRPQS